MQQGFPSAPPRPMIRPRSLWSRMLTALTILSGLFLLCAWLVEEHVILPRFAELEAREAQADLGRAAEALRAELTHLDEFAADWARDEDTQRFVRGNDAALRRGRSGAELLGRESADFLCLLDADGAELLRAGRAPDGRACEVEELPDGNWPLEHPLLGAHEPADSRTSILPTRHGPLMLAARAVAGAEGAARPAGWLVLGRFLDARRCAELGRRTGLVLALRTAGDESTPEARAAIERLREGARCDLVESDAGTLAARALVPTLAAGRELVLEARLSRPIWERGQRAMDEALVLSAVVVLVLALTAVFLLQRGVAGPIETLTRRVVDLGEHGQAAGRCALGRDDELGVLSEEFDALLERLSESRARAAETARHCGRSEATDALLSDLRQALQALETQTLSLGERLSERNLHDLERLSQLLAEHARGLERWLAEDPRGQQLPPFLQALAGALLEEQSALRADLERLRGGLAELETRVARRAEQGGARATLERVDLAELLESVVHQTAGAGEESAHIERALEHVPPLLADRERLRGVLTHLVRNARHAVQSRPPARRRIRLELAPVDAQRVRLVVEDDGPGPRKGELERIFESRADATGPRQRPGLRECAREVRALGGRLWAAGAARGEGLRFVLELPLAPAAPADGAS